MHLKSFLYFYLEVFVILSLTLLWFGNVIEVKLLFWMNRRIIIYTANIIDFRWNITLRQIEALRIHRIILFFIVLKLIFHYNHLCNFQLFNSMLFLLKIRIIIHWFFRFLQVYASFPCNDITLIRFISHILLRTSFEFHFDFFP